jgi:hypothetical protein
MPATAKTGHQKPITTGIPATLDTLATGKKTAKTVTPEKVAAPENSDACKSWDASKSRDASFHMNHDSCNKKIRVVAILSLSMPDGSAQQESLFSWAFHVWK